VKEQMVAAPRIVRAARVLIGFDRAGRPELRENAAILVEGTRIVDIGEARQIRADSPGAEEIGGDGYLAMPGLVNAHHHIGLTPLQLGSPDHSLELWFASRLALRDIDLRLDTLYSAFEMISSGVTTVQHLHSRAPGNQDAVLKAAGDIIGAYEEIGMRASYSFALRDQNRLVYEADEAFLQRVPSDIRPALASYFAKFALPLAEQIGVFRELCSRYRDSELIAIQIAPANLHWLSDAALESAARLSEETGAPMHMHLLETPYQKAYARKRTAGSAMAHVERMGLAGPRLTLGHGVWMTEEDLEICAHTGTMICHNCSSNFRLKSGVAPVVRMLDRDLPVALGIDEAGINDDRDMLQEMRLVLVSHRAPGIESRAPTAAEVLRMAIEHGARTTSYASKIGRLEPGRQADIVLIDWKKVTWPYQDSSIPPVDVLVQRAKRENVDTVMIAGRVVYSKGRFMLVDRDEILSEIARKLEAPLSVEELSRRHLADGVMASVRRFYNGYLEGRDLQRDN
jgi:cytosine/adenosine deaminase-related metal-dependent hydrolase